MSWDQIGYTDNLIREDTESVNIELDPLQFEQYAPEFSGAKINGIVQSQSGRVKIDLDNNAFIISDGTTERIRLGKLLDDSIGLLIQDINGNKLMQISGDTNLIQSSSAHMQLNFNDETLIVTDEGGTPIVLIGKLS